MTIITSMINIIQLTSSKQYTPYTEWSEIFCTINSFTWSPLQLDCLYCLTRMRRIISLAHLLFLRRAESRFLGFICACVWVCMCIGIFCTCTLTCTQKYSYCISHMKSICVKSVFGCRSLCENTENQSFFYRKILTDRLVCHTRAYME